MRRALKVWLIVCGALAVMAMAGFVLFAAVVFHLPAQNTPGGDAIVVLTGGDLRLREGFKLFAAGGGRRLLISGVNVATTKDDIRRLSGISPLLLDCCVDMDYAARDTIGNAAETRRWLSSWGFRRLVVVTSNYHMPRSLLELARALPGVELVPHAVQSKYYRADEWFRHPSAVRLVASEYAKYVSSAGLGLARHAMGFAGTQPLPVRAGPEVSSSQLQRTGF